MILWIDTKILSIFQKFTDKFQQWFGVSKFFWEKWTYIIHSLLFVAVIIKNYLVTKELFTIPILIISIILLLTVLQTKAIENEQSIFEEKGSLLFSIHRETGIRIPLIVFWVIILSILLYFNSEEVLLICSGIIIICFYYFSACTPKPPSKSLIQKFYEKVLKKINHVLEPVPETTQ